MNEQEDTVIFPLDVLLAYMAPQPNLPLASAVAIAAGVTLMFGRRAIQCGMRWLGAASGRSLRAGSRTEQ